MSGIRQYVVFVSDIFPLAYAFEIHPYCMHLNLFIKSPVHCCCSVAQSCRTLCDPLDCSTPGFPVLQSFPEFAKLMSIESMMTPNHVILCHPLLLLLQSFPTSGSFPVSRLCIRWPKYWSFSISPSNEYSGSVSFKIDWFDLLAVQRTLKSLLRHHSSEVSVLQRSAFFTVLLYVQVKKQRLELDMEQWTVPNWERSPSRLCVVTLLIELTCRVHPEKCWAGCSTSWNQDFWDGDTMNKAAINIVFFCTGLCWRSVFISLGKIT